MIKPGSLVRLDLRFRPITHGVFPHSNLIGMVIETETAFYGPSLVPQSRHRVLWGNETYTYEPTNALIEVLPDGD
jgi:hypothetical protein